MAMITRVKRNYNAMDNGNQWAYLTNMTMRSNMVNEYLMDGSITHLGRGPAEVEFTGIAPATPEILSAIKHWMYNDQPRFPFYAEEWMCLYCGSPNALPETHCKKCGAPRNWLIG